MAVTRRASGEPLRTSARRGPCVTVSGSPVTASTAAPAWSTARSLAFARRSVGRRSSSSFAKTRRGAEAWAKTGSSAHGLPSRTAASTAMRAARSRSASMVPRFTSSASAKPTKSATSAGAIVVDGVAPAARRTLAVTFCATALVMQWTCGRRVRKRSSTSAQSSAVGVASGRSSTPFPPPARPGSGVGSWANPLSPARIGGAPPWSVSSSFEPSS